MQSILTEMQYTLHPADVRVRHVMPGVNLESFYAFEKIVLLGEAAAQQTFFEAGLLPWDGTERRRIARGRVGASAPV